eukprot:s1904_g3.t2
MLQRSSDLYAEWLNLQIFITRSRIVATRRDFQDFTVPEAFSMSSMADCVQSMHMGVRSSFTQRFSACSAGHSARSTLPPSPVLTTACFACMQCNGRRTSPTIFFPSCGELDGKGGAGTSLSKSSALLQQMGMEVFHHLGAVVINMVCFLGLQNAWHLMVWTCGITSVRASIFNVLAAGDSRSRRSISFALIFGFFAAADFALAPLGGMASGHLRPLPRAHRLGECSWILEGCRFGISWRLRLRLFEEAPWCQCPSCSSLRQWRGQRTPSGAFHSRIRGAPQR